ncbi:hypothetical protein [Streptacidiphilus sp. EB103A]|uniref:hypothetical protein n=1 Tax=Streptacidiphilus sp. EB103A TaxID=3156275 RepID=UPI0035137AB6
MSSAFHGSGLGGRPLPDRPGRRGPAAVPAAPPAAGPLRGDAAAAKWRSATESPEQRAIAAHIYAELKAGADVDQVRPLIDRLRQAVTDQARSVDRGVRR